jgi:DNA polymerase-3 subunit delta'
MLAPRETSLFLGHEAAEAALFAAAAGQRLPHAWLIGGPRGVGKATLAFRFARFLLAAVPGAATLALDAAHPTFRRVAADTHADLLTVALAFDPVRKRMRTEITVDDVREVSAFMRLTPAEGGWRVVIVDGAEHMNRFGANALLKVLEEPPPRAVLLLVSHTPGALLPTLRSRCRALDLAPLGQGALRALLEHHLPELRPDQLGRLIALADGSLGRALTLAEGEGLAMADLAADVLDQLPRLSTARLHGVADQVGRGEAAFSTFIDLLRRALATAIRQAARGAPDALGQKLAALRPLAAWSEVWQALGRLQDETEHAYLDRRQAVVSALRLLSQ